MLCQLIAIQRGDTMLQQPKTYIQPNVISSHKSSDPITIDVPPLHVPMNFDFFISNNSNSTSLQKSLPRHPPYDHDGHIPSSYPVYAFPPNNSTTLMLPKQQLNWPQFGGNISVLNNSSSLLKANQSFPLKKWYIAIPLLRLPSKKNQTDPVSIN